MSFFRIKFGEKRNKSSANVEGATKLSRTPSNCSSKSLPQSPDSWGEESDIGIPPDAFAGGGSRLKRPRTLLLSETVLLDEPDIPIDSLESPMRTSSRLSKTLLEVVRDKDALSCLKAFMRSQGMEQIIQFWCEAESFCASTLSRRRTHSLQQIAKHRTESTNSLKDITSPKTELCPSNSQMSSNLQTAQVCIGAAEDKNESNHHSSTTNDEKITACHGTQSEISEVNERLKASDKTVTSIQDHTGSAPKLKSLSPDSVPNSESTNSPGSLQLCQRNESVLRASKTPNSLSLGVEPQSVTPEQEEGFVERLAVPQVSGVSPSDEPADVKKVNSPEDLATKLKKSIERDAVSIFSTYLAKDAPKPIGVDDDLRTEAISKICREDGEVDPECFVQCQKFALDKISNEYFQSFKDSECYCRHQVNVLTTEKIYLPDILNNENALCYYMEYMEQEDGSDLMQMWLAAANFQQQLTLAEERYDWEQAQNDAMVIYDRYFSLQATNPLGFDDKLRFEIEGNICREGGPLPDCFVKAKNIVLKILEKMYFPAYLQSQVYYRYLSDLVSTVQMAEDMPNKPFQKGHRRAESDASSEHSFGSQSIGAESVVSRNTLLAVDTRKHRKGTAPALNIEGDFNMTPDMFNPDNLWKRPEVGDLSLGSVNHMGQFVSGFEQDTEAEKKKGSGFFKRRKEKEKEQEEVALRIAQMIISDVNTMTKTGETMIQGGGGGC